MSFKDYYTGPPDPTDLYEIFCIDCEHCSDNGECMISRTPEDCARDDADNMPDDEPAGLEDYIWRRRNE